MNSLAAKVSPPPPTSPPSSENINDDVEEKVAPPYTTLITTDLLLLHPENVFKHFGTGNATPLEWYAYQSLWNVLMANFIGVFDRAPYYHEHLRAIDITVEYRSPTTRTIYGGLLLNPENRKLSLGMISPPSKNTDDFIDTHPVLQCVEFGHRWNEALHELLSIALSIITIGGISSMQLELITTLLFKMQYWYVNTLSSEPESAVGQFTIPRVDCDDRARYNSFMNSQTNPMVVGLTVPAGKSTDCEYLMGYTNWGRVYLISATSINGNALRCFSVHSTDISSATQHQVVFKSPDLGEFLKRE